MKKFMFHLLLMGFISFSLSCEKNNNNPENYDSCCGSESVEFTLGDGYVFVPNVFTPNGDGINDVFLPFINDKITSVTDFSVISEANSSVLFSLSNVDVSAPLTNSWDGFKPNGSAYKGLFSYEFTVQNNTGQTMVISGHACCIVCGPDADIFETMEGCFYPIQGLTIPIDPNSPNYEQSCW